MAEVLGDRVIGRIGEILSAKLEVRVLAKKLDFTDKDVAEIESRVGMDSEVIPEMLSKWRHKKGAGLHQALELKDVTKDIGLDDEHRDSVCETIKTAIDQQHTGYVEVITDDVIYDLSSGIPFDKRGRLGQKLGFSHINVDGFLIMAKVHGSLEEQNQQMLFKWKVEEGAGLHQASDLKWIMKELKLSDAKNIIQTAIEKKFPKPPETRPRLNEATEATTQQVPTLAQTHAATSACASAGDDVSSMETE